MKLEAAPTHFEAISPAIWASFRKMVQESAALMGLHVEFIDGPTVAAAQRRFSELLAIQNAAQQMADADALTSSPSFDGIPVSGELNVKPEDA